MGARRTAILVLDRGLTAVKAALVDRAGRFVAISRRFWGGGARTFDLARDLDAVWPTVASAGRLALAEARPGVAVAALSVSAAARLGVCLDAAGTPFALPRPDDGRPLASGLHLGSSGYGRTLLRTVRAARFRHPDAYRRIARAGALHTYVLWRLTGAWRTDPATGPGGLEWPATLERSTRLPRAAFPEILPQEAVAGPLGAEAAAALELPPGVPVVVGGHDGACASFGAGAYRPGDGLLNLSTNFVPRLVTGRVVPGLFGYPIRPGTWAWVDGLPLCGRQIDLAARTILGAEADSDAASDLAIRALDHVSGEVRLVPMPYLAAGAIDRQGARVKAALAGGERPAAAVYAAVVAGCAEALAARVREGRRWGIQPRRYVATGGFSRQTVVVELLRRALGSPVELADPEAGALGAAALAAPAAGWFATPEKALAQWSPGGADGA